MKQYFTVLIGGIILLSVGITIFSHDYFHARSNLLNYINYLASSGVANITKAVSTPVENATISGLKRLIRYSASEEENLINTATLSLLKNSENEISAKSYLVIRLGDGKKIIEKNADKILPIASLTKLVTAVSAKKLIKDNTKIKISSQIMNTYGNTAQFKVGETIYAGDLYYPLLMVSSNDAAEALARSYNRKKFIDYMNNFAQSIGAYRTIFKDPAGLSKDNLSSANDLAIIYSWIERKYPELIAITKEKTKTNRLHTWTNPAYFLNWSNYEGGKNGYTEEALQTGLAVFHINKERYLLVVLGSKSRNADIVKLLGKIDR
jgi:D-alanyl-D-alanine carboxypeptidase